MWKRIVIACAFVALITCVVWAQEGSEDDMQKTAKELEQVRQEIYELQIEILEQQIAFIESQSPDSQALLAMQSILSLKISQVNVKNSLSGAKIIADDGTYLGSIGPTYDIDSIFCSYGTYGATYSMESIWCTYGTYGASYSTLSPFCSYSTTPPKIIIDGITVASLTAGWAGFPVSISPNALKAIFGHE